MWGDHPAPLDHVAIGTAQPITLIDSWSLRFGAKYFLGVLGGPHVYEHPLVSSWRLHFDLFGRLTMEVQHLIQLGGEGARYFNFVDFLHANISKTETNDLMPNAFENRRLGADLTMTFPDFYGARVHFGWVMEDTLTRFDTEADYNLGLELHALGAHSAWIELLKTGYRSHEHTLYTTGLTQDSRIVGNPLGPEAYAAAVGGRIHTAAGELYPSLEYADLDADIYTLFLDPVPTVDKTEDLPSERRLRARLRWSREWSPGVRLDVEGLYEYITGFEYVPGRVRHAYGGRAVLAIDLTE